MIKISTTSFLSGPQFQFHCAKQYLTNNKIKIKNKIRNLKFHSRQKYNKKHNAKSHWDCFISALAVI